MASKPPGDFNDGQTDHCWDAAGKWYMCSQWTDQGGGVQVWRYDGEGKGEQGTGWTRVYHVPNPKGYYCHGFAFALQVGKMKVCYRGQDKATILGDDIPGFAKFVPLGAA